MSRRVRWVGWLERAIVIFFLVAIVGRLFDGHEELLMIIGSGVMAAILVPFDDLWNDD